jgi:effector-binding domain-containing protein
MDIEIKSVEKRPVVGIRRRIESSEIGNFIPEAFATVGSFFNSEGMEMTGPPVAIYYAVDGQHMDVAAGAPVTKVTETSGEITELELSAGRVATAVYTGPYEGISAAWDELMSEISSRDEKSVEPCREEYLTDPSEEPDSSKWQTLLVQPLND